eukprot:365280-Chlamydomonas_euryale.AAC.3
MALEHVSTAALEPSPPGQETSDVGSPPIPLYNRVTPAISVQLIQFSDSLTHPTRNLLRCTPLLPLTRAQRSSHLMQYLHLFPHITSHLAPRASHPLLHGTIAADPQEASALDVQDALDQMSTHVSAVEAQLDAALSRAEAAEASRCELMEEARD